MRILGINGGFGGGYQDACACLYADGRIVAAVEEERLIKTKFAPGHLPLKAIHEVLDLGNTTMADIDQIAFHGISWPQRVEEELNTYIRHHFGLCPPVFRVHHHDAHAASTFYLSGFDEALVITIDNSGDGISSQLMTGRNGKLELLKRWERPNSFGSFYSCITQLCGFERDAGEYKLMGLAPYGHADRYDLSPVLQYTGEGDYRLDTSYLYPITAGQGFPNKQIPLYSDKLLQLLGLPASGRITDDAVKRDLAAAAQKQLEAVVCDWIRYWVERTGIKNICLAGGVAMNCVMNRRILESCGINALFVPPFAGDQGISAGAAFLAGADAGIMPDHEFFSAYTGREFSTNEIRTILDRDHIPYRELADPVKTAADHIASGKIIGWFQGKAEIGPRALGNRSILANPAIPDMKDRINRAIKFRESFRPFCPSVPEEDFSYYFSSPATRIPHMNITAACLENTIRALPAIVHQDQTARVQTVCDGDNPLYYQLLLELKARTGHGVVLNTSLNVRNQPMAYDVQDALITLYTSGMDALFLGNLLVEK